MYHRISYSEYIWFGEFISIRAVVDELFSFEGFGTTRDKDGPALRFGEYRGVCCPATQSLHS